MSKGTSVNLYLLKKQKFQKRLVAIRSYVCFVNHHIPHYRVLFVIDMNKKINNIIFCDRVIT